MIVVYAVGHGSLGQAPAINHTTLKAKGFSEEAIAKVEKALPTAFDIKFAVNKWTLGAACLRDERGGDAEDLAASNRHVEVLHGRAFCVALAQIARFNRPLAHGAREFATASI